MRINKEGLELIKRFEGCKLEAYQDIVGVWTIGYGDTENVKPGMKITQAEAEERLAGRLIRFEVDVLELVPGSISENQFSALVCFTYNVGINAFKRSMLLRCCQKYNWDHAAREFLKWNHAGGRIVRGLTRRREAERALFLKE